MSVYCFLTRKIQQRESFGIGKEQELNKAEDILKNPYVFEFLGIQKANRYWKKIWKPNLSATLKIFIGIGKRFYVCRLATTNNHKQYTLLWIWFSTKNFTLLYSLLNSNNKT